MNSSPKDGESRAEILGAVPVLEILLIEDEPDLSALIMEYLDMESMRCDNAMTGPAGLKLAQDADGIGYDCIILDLNLPLLDGLSVCRGLRQAGIATPVIMLTARDRLEDKLEGFSNGADDYLCKPFEMQELVARINVLAHRKYRNSILQCDSLAMDIAARTVTRGGKVLSLSATEWKLLHLLLSHSPRPVSKQKLISGIWGEPPPDSGSLKVHVHNLRRAIDLPGETPLLHTVPGHGYALCAKKMILRGKVSLTLFVCVSCAAIALVSVLIYSALSMEFFRMGIESIHEAQLQIAVHDYAAAQAAAEAGEGRTPDASLNRIRVVARPDLLPPQLRELAGDGSEGALYRTVIIDRDGSVEGIYCFLTLALGGETYYAWQRVSQHEAEAYIRPQVFSRIYTVLGVGAALLGLLLLFIVLILKRIRRPTTILSRWTAGLNARNVDEPLPDLVYPELYVIAGMMRENLKKQYENVRREELIWRYCSHELRTPISIINIGLELLQKTLIRNDRAAGNEIRVIARLQRATHSMSHLVSTLLWLGRNDLSPLKDEHIELSLFLRSIVDDFLRIFPQDSRKIRIRSSRHISRIPGPALRIVLENIIRNAFQHAREDSIHIVQKENRITVINTMHAGNALRENTGFGLGLELTERLTDRLGWEFSYSRRGGTHGRGSSCRPERRREGVGAPPRGRPFLPRGAVLYKVGTMHTATVSRQRRAGAACPSGARRRGVVLMLVALLLVAHLLPPQTGFAAGRQGARREAPAPVYTGGRVLKPGADAAPAGPLDMPAAVARALERNPSLGAQEAQSRASEEGRKSARGAFGPKLGMTYSAIKQERKAEPRSVRPPELGSYSWGVEISQPVFQGFRLLNSYQKAALQAESDKAALRRAELAMTEQVQTEFLNYLRAEENVRSEGDSLARLRDQLRITKAFYEVGLRPRLDVLQAEVNVSEAENILIQAENTRDTAQARLNTLLGFAATAPARYVGRLDHVPFRRSLEQCLEAAYRQRPDLMIAARAVEMAGKDRRMVQSDYYPQIEAYYNINQTGNTLDLQREGDNGSRSATWEVGARAVWNVFQWGVTYYADQQAGWQVTRLRHEEEDLRLNVGYDVKSKLLAVHEAEKRIAVAEKGVAQAREAYDTAVARYQEQVGTNFDVLDASANLTRAQASLTGARADYLTALAQIYVAMGEYHPDLGRAR